VNKFSELRRTKAAKTGKKAAPVAPCGTLGLSGTGVSLTDFYGHGVTQTEASEALGTVKLLARTLGVGGQVNDVPGVATLGAMRLHIPPCTRPSGSMPSHAATLPLDATTDL
jgi:hypothetical protein